MSERETTTALYALLFGLFAVSLSIMAVLPSMPRIVADLRGSQADYTWIVAAPGIAIAICTPVWGKLADLFDRKRLTQVALLLFVAVVSTAGQSVSPGMLIAVRFVQGAVVAGALTLVAIVVADVVDPRQRGRYMGLLGAASAAGTLAGPLVGGLATDTLGWRWNFYLGAPVALVAVVLLQRTLHLPVGPRREPRIDYLGTALLTACVGQGMVLLTFGGHQFRWNSLPVALLVTAMVGCGALFVFVERRVGEPVMPLDLFRSRPVAVAIFPGAVVGAVQFAVPVLLPQYLQLARGMSPAESGLMTLPLVGGTLVSSAIAGRLISRTGTWRPFLIAGAVDMAVGLALLGTLSSRTNLVVLGGYLAVLGVGVGMLNQHLVTVVQNSVPNSRLGVATSTITFFRSVGGAIGVAALGTVLAARLPALSQGILRRESAVPHLDGVDPATRAVIQNAYGHGVAEAFLVMVPLLVAAAATLVLLPRTRVPDDRSASGPDGSVDEVPRRGTTLRYPGDEPVA